MEQGGRCYFTGFSPSFGDILTFIVLLHSLAAGYRQYRMDKQPFPRSPLTEDDVRGIIRLLGEVIATPGGIDSKREVLMHGLCGLVGATSWIWSVTAPSGEPASGELAKNRADSLITGLPAPESENGPLMVAQQPAEDGTISRIGVYRAPALPCFNERETSIADVIFSQVSWLHLRAFPREEDLALVRLYPRHRTVAKFLQEGWSRKKIAGHLQLSINTVHGYARAIFLHFGVHSQAELIYRLTKGGGRA